MTYQELAAQIAISHPPDDLPYVVAALSEQVTGMQAELETLRDAMREREQWRLRQRIATDAQHLAVIRQVAIPALLQRIRESGA